MSRFQWDPITRWATIIGTLIGAVALVLTIVSFLGGSSSSQAPSMAPPPRPLIPSSNRTASPSNNSPATNGPLAAGPWKPLPAGSWRSFGIAKVSTIDGDILRVAFDRPLTLANKWAGVIAKISPSCQYVLKMQARVTSQFGSHSGGYGIASGRLVSDSLPEEFATLNHQWHSIRIVVMSGVSAYVDGRPALSKVPYAKCGVPITSIRVWSATAEFRNIMIKVA
jgi:hypothetical protein